MVSFPLKASSNSRFLVDSNGKPFSIQGEATWDSFINLSGTDLQTYVTDRQSRGFTMLATYLMNSVAYYSGSNAPWLYSLGGSSAGTSALPFLLNTSGTAWNGDPTFTNHDAAFSSPNDAYWAQVLSFAQMCETAGIVCVFWFMYLGYFNGSSYDDGWSNTLENSTNTESVCFAFGQYLASGHGSFAGFAGQSNIIWLAGGDSLPSNGGTIAVNALAVLRGMQANGDTHLVALGHWQHDYLPLTQTDFASYATAYAAYTHGSYPTMGPTYGESLAIYGTESPSRPAFLIETAYWGGGNATRPLVRYFSWGAFLSCIGGQTWDCSPQWGFVTSADGTTGTPSGGGTTAWVPSTSYLIDELISHVGNWYLCTTAGTSANSGGPTGTGSSITDGSAVWAYYATVGSTIGGMSTILGQAACEDQTVLANFVNSIEWYNLVPSDEGSIPVLVTAGQGTYTSWSNGNPEVGGLDWITAAASPDGFLLVAYIPDAHSGSFSITLPFKLSMLAYWIDPTTGARTQVSGSVAGGATKSFTTPGANAGGNNDWVLLMQSINAIFFSMD
jgi:Protein of unknown function (DUF4038)/Putative collagen-binding domain of a collagenase